MNIVITHINPDFDALASAYAAFRLFECDHIAVCSQPENNVSKFLEDTNFNLPLKMYGQKDLVELDCIDKLIITDCNNTKRVGIFADVISKAKDVIIFDHHPSQACDIEQAEKHIETIGSTSTILTLLLEKNNITLSSIEATFLMLAIHEDTGLLTFSSTCREDALALAYLISQNAETTSVNDYIQRELSHIQVVLLNELLLNLSTITVAGVNIAYSFATIDEYVGEAAFITQKLMLIEGLESLFVMLSTGGRVVLVGRSNDSRVNVLKVVSQFGGGGHTSAASAIIKDIMISEAVEKLKFTIRDAIKPIKTVRELMTTHVKSVSADVLLKDVFDITMKYNLNHLPVTEGDKVVGIISRKDILHGMKHGLDEEKLYNIMQTEFEVVSPNTPFYEAEEIMVYQHQKILPVVENSILVGVVTRTDLLRLMHEDIIIHSKYADSKRQEQGISKSRNVSDIIKDVLPKNIIELLKDIGKEAESFHYKAYVVGGFVRDLLMRISSNFDIDIVIEGDAAKFATEYAKKRNAKVFVHHKFKTAVVILSDGLKIDFATSRTEYYITPAAAPEVEEASIKSDLFRRDFTINAMAVRLDGAQYGYLFDFFRGQKDIHDKKIRILHSLSFIDDPSRALRAIRFAVRFNFSIGSHTDRLIKHAESLNLFSRIIGHRLFVELKYILDENGYLEALSLMNQYNMLRFYSEEINYDQDLIDKFERLENLINWFNIQIGEHIDIWRTRFNVLFFLIKGEDYPIFINKFQLPVKEDLLLKNDHKFMEYAISLLKRYKKHKPSFIYGICSQLSIESALALAAVMGHAKQDIIKNYLVSYRHIKHELNGDDLLALGIKKGPLLKEILDKLLKLRIDGELNSREDEINYVRNNYGE